MTYFFTGDTHFSHTNIIKYTNRPFTSAADMDAAIIQKWNEVVKPNDFVYHVGDVAFCDPMKATGIVQQLNGHKFLVFGNHDKRLRHDGKFLAQFEWAKDFAEIKVPDANVRDGAQTIVLCHYAMRVWNKSHHGSWQLYGHSHGSLPDDQMSLSTDVGVDVWDYAPVSYERIKDAMSLKKFRQIDHHGSDRNVKHELTV